MEEAMWKTYEARVVFVVDEAEFPDSPQTWDWETLLGLPFAVCTTVSAEPTTPESEAAFSEAADVAQELRQE